MISRQEKGNLLKKSVLISASVLVAFILGEVGARLVFPKGSSDKFIPDPIVGFRHEPNQRVWKTNLSRDFGVWMETNSFGDRDIERSIKKPNGTYRIAILGDSMVEASQVVLEDRFTFLLESALTRWIQTCSGRLRKVEVLNFGVSRFGTAQEWLYYKSHVSAFSPDLVVIVFLPYNDVQNNNFQLEVVQSGRPQIMPFFYVDDTDNLRVKDHQFYSNAVRIFGTEANRNSQNTIDWVRSHCRLAQVINELYYVRRSGRHEQKVSIGLYAPQIQKKSEDWKQAWRVTGKIIQQLFSDVKADGAEFHVVVATAPNELIPTSPEATETSDYDAGLANRKTISMLRELNVSYTNLLPNMIAATQSGVQVNFKVDKHYNPRGHRIIADELLPTLKAYILKRLH